MFSGASILRCLARRGNGRIFFVGNSFARGLAFALQRLVKFGLAQLLEWLLRKHVYSRMEEKAQSPKGRTNATAYSCELQLEGSEAQAHAGLLSMRFLWRPSLMVSAQHILAPEKPYLPDYCEGLPMQECYQPFFNGSRPGDILIQNIGRGYAEALQTTRGFIPSIATRLAIDDFDAFFAADLFRGDVVHVTMPHAEPTGPYAGFDDWTDHINNVLVAHLAANFSRVVVVDEAAFVRGDIRAEDAWEDAIHPPAQHYLAILFHAFTELCGVEAEEERAAARAGPAGG